MDCPAGSSSSLSSWNTSEGLDSNHEQSHSDLGLDPSDPLNLLIHNVSNGGDSISSMEDASSAAYESPPDWSELSALWSTNPDTENQGMMGENVKFPHDGGMDFNFSFPMDLDFNPAIAIEPSALHFDNSGFSPLNFSLSTSSEPAFVPPPNELLNVPFPMSLQSDANGEPFQFSGHIQGTRRLSMTSSSSSSGASLSPVLEHNPPIDTASYNSSMENINATEELAHRARQAAGVTLAVQVSSQMQQAMASGPHGSQPKLPIPRLPRSSNTPGTFAPKAKRLAAKPTDSSSSSRSPTPPPSSHTSSPSPSSSIPPAPSSGRGKTSHTTIERRYRTNLNARIQSLRRAVPALRVLEQKEGKVDFGDVVNERGYVDGVRVARKTSKASILGKAVEYIRVLKKREARMRREQDGLRCLMCGLVGGPALLKEWEREWREKFGGEEKDEIDDNEAEPGSDDDDDEGEGDGEGEDKEEREGRAKKRARVVKATKKEKERERKIAPAAGARKSEPANAVDLSSNVVVPEKRKRGRPRKVPVAAPSESMFSEQVVLGVPLSANLNMNGIPKQEEEQGVPVGESHGQGQPVPQYLLAVFAFFSFFNSPLTSSSPASAHTHTGTVLSPVYDAQHVQPSVVHGFGLKDVVPAFHLLVSALIFLSIVLPWLPSVYRRSRLASFILSPFSVYSSTSTSRSSQEGFSSSPRHAAAGGAEAPDRKHDPALHLTSALCASYRGEPHEAVLLRQALGVCEGVFGLVQGVLLSRKSGSGYERRQAEQRAWVRLGELAVLDGTSSVATRLQTYFCMRLRTPYFKACSSDLCTLALIIYPVSKANASWFWARALQTEFVRPYERLVLESMTVGEAVERLAKRRSFGEQLEMDRKERGKGYWASSPLRVLGEILVCEKLRKHAAILFVRTVLVKGAKSGDEEEDCVGRESHVYDSEKEVVLERERRFAVDAGKSLAGRTAEVSEILEKIWETGFCALDDRGYEHGASGHVADELDLEVFPLIRAIMLYRQIFPSCLAGAEGQTAISLILSPPPSPSRKSPALLAELRATLGSAFDYMGMGNEESEEDKLGMLLEDARDQVVGIIEDEERMRRRS